MSTFNYSEDGIVDQNDENTTREELYEIDHDTWVAQEAAKLGFPIAGFVKDIYEDAVILIGPMFRFDWAKNKIKMGRVIHITEDRGDGYPRPFVMMLENGTQVSCTYGDSYECYFALPEDTEEVFR